MIKKLYILCMFLFVMLFFVYCSTHSKEDGPVYNGKSLKTWIVLYSEGNDKDRENAVCAITHIGENGLPYLVKWIDQKEAQKGRNKECTMQHYLGSIGVTSHFRYNFSGAALNGFRVLGESASNAVPALAKLVLESQCNSGPINAHRALGYIGNSGIEALSCMLANTNSLQRILAVEGIGVTTNGINKLKYIMENSEYSDVRRVAAGILTDYKKEVPRRF